MLRHLHLSLVRPHPLQMQLIENLLKDPWIRSSEERKSQWALQGGKTRIPSLYPIHEEPYLQQTHRTYNEHVINDGKASAAIESATTSSLNPQIRSFHSKNETHTVADAHQRSAANNFLKNWIRNRNSQQLKIKLKNKDRKRTIRYSDHHKLSSLT